MRHLKWVPSQGYLCGLQCLGTRSVAHPYLGLTLSPLLGPVCALRLSAGPPAATFSLPWTYGLRGEPGLGFEKSWFSPQPGHYLIIPWASVFRSV